MLINLKRGEEIKQSVCPDTCILYIGLVRGVFKQGGGGR